jgi:hypothetical protein
MDDRRDIVRWIADWLLADEESITQTLELRCERMERAAREVWGGQDVWVNRTMEGKVGRPPASQQIPQDDEARALRYRLLRRR